MKERGFQRTVGEDTHISRFQESLTTASGVTDEPNCVLSHEYWPTISNVRELSPPDTHNMSNSILFFVKWVLNILKHIDAIVQHLVKQSISISLINIIRNFSKLFLNMSTSCIQYFSLQLLDRTFSPVNDA